MKIISFICLLVIPVLASSQEENVPPVLTTPEQIEFNGEKELDTLSNPMVESIDNRDRQELYTDVEDLLKSLSALNESIAWREQQRENIYQKMQAAVDPVQREKLLPELQKINKDIQDLKRNFQSIAVNTDFSIFEEEPEKEFNWQTELGQLIEPFMKEMKAATKDAREMGELQDQLEGNQIKKKTAEQALENLEPLLEAEKNPVLKESLNELETLWEGRLRDAKNNITAVEYQIEVRNKEKESPLEQAKGMASGFVRTRGLNLFLGVVAVVAVFLIMNGLQKLWSKYRPSRKKGRSFSARLSSLLWNILTILLGVGTMMATFNATGDWFLVSLTILFLLGVGWAGMKALPGMMELFRMMLNMGAVREDERLVYQGLPWKVNAISFRTELINPLLNGGVLTLPTRMLVGQLSRPQGEDEEWFPSKKDDWVHLSDGTFGKVSYQTPSSVQIVSPGGSQRVYTTIQYMELSPTVLSTGFRREIIFGIDYRHVREVTTLITGTMNNHLQEVLNERLDGNLQHLDVQLAEATDSALKLCVIVDCKGDAAKQWPYLPMWIHMELVELCNQKGWSIPVPQLRVHTESR